MKRREKERESEEKKSEIINFIDCLVGKNIKKVSYDHVYKKIQYL